MKLTAGAVPPSPDVVPGIIVQYDDAGAVLLGVVSALKKEKLVVFTIRGREVELPKGRVYQLPGKEPAGAAASSAARVAHLVALEQAIEAEAAALDVAELWSFVHTEARLFQVRELSELYLGSDSLQRHAGMRLALIREHRHFKRDREGFEPRTPEVVENLLKAEQAQRKKDGVRERTAAWITERVRNPAVGIPEEVRENVRLLEEVAAGVPHSDPARQKEVKQLLQLCVEQLSIAPGMAPEKQAFEVLLAIGHFHRDSNLSFIRHEIPVAHEQEVLDEAAQVPLPRSVAEFAELERATRTDLSALRCITIDDVSTKDMDDALSLEQTQDGWELGIHITDLTWAMHPESKLERAARRRATSLYCADQTVNMLPELLSEQCFSLCAGELRACISVLVQLSPSFEVVTWRILPSCIRVAQRYTYEEVDQALEQGDHLLLTLHDIAAAGEERRIRAGAVKVHRREAVPHLGPDGRVWLQEIDEESPARALVAEMMVLGNALMANFAAEHGIPVLFRGQERMDDERSDLDRESNRAERPEQDGSAGGEQSPQGREETPAGPAKDYGVRAKMKKSTLSFSPQPHAGLGLPAYIQATSPIRRYIDICHQRQILSYLRTAQPWIDEETFAGIAAEVENNLAAANSASRETRRYWLQRYLKQRGMKEPIEATVIRTDLKMPLVELDEVYLTVFARIPGKAQLGQRVRLQITALDPHADYFRLEVV